MAEKLDFRTQSLIKRERDRALRMEDPVKRAVRLVEHYKTNYENTKKELEEVKKQLVEAQKRNKRLDDAVNLTDSNTFSLIFAKLDSITHKEIKSAIRKALHPDKMRSLSDKAKRVMGEVFYVMEGYLK